MDEVAKTPQLQRRSNGIFYYRARLPSDVLRAISSNSREWKRRTSKRGAPVEAWSKLVGKNGELKKELWYSLETRDLNAAKRALPTKQVELNNLFEQIIRLLAGEQNTPTMRDVERLAAIWFAERDAGRRHSNLSVSTDEDTEDLLREDLANAQSQRPENLSPYQKIAEALLFKEGFATDWTASPVRSLVQLIQRGRIELCQRALGEDMGPSFIYSAITADGPYIDGFSRLALGSSKKWSRVVAWNSNIEAAVHALRLIGAYGFNPGRSFHQPSSVARDDIGSAPRNVWMQVFKEYSKDASTLLGLIFCFLYSQPNWTEEYLGRAKKEKGNERQQFVDAVLGLKSLKSHPMRSSVAEALKHGIFGAEADAQR